MRKMMLNELNLAGCVSPLLLIHTVLGVSKHVLHSLLARRETIITNSPKSKYCAIFIAG